MNIGDIYVPRMYDSCCQMGVNQFMISGGYDGQYYTNECVSLRLSKYQNQYYFRVDQKQNMNLERITHKLFNLENGYIMAVGGKKNHYLTSCEVYNVQNDEWTFIQSLNVARS